MGFGGMLPSNMAEGRLNPSLGQLGQMALMPTLKQRLDSAVQEAESRLAAVKEAREIFERNPDIERLLDIMQRSHF